MSKKGKIISIVYVVAVFCILAFIGIKYLLARIELDDEAMFVYGQDFMVASLFCVIIFVTIIIVAMIWVEDKKE